RRLFHGNDRGDLDPGSRFDAGGRETWHRSGAVRRHHGAEPDDRPAHAAGGTRALRAVAGGKTVIRPDRDGGAAVSHPAAVRAGPDFGLSVPDPVSADPVVSL